MTYLTVATRAARQAGRLLIDHMGKPRTVRTKTGITDLVTEIDRASEHLLHEAIRRHFPDHGFQGEERTRTQPDAPYQWIVDPLDGTTNFVHGVPAFAVSMALVHHGTLVVGLIYDPTRNELFTAIRHAGAWLNGHRLHVSRTRHLAQSLLATGFSPASGRQMTRCVQWLKTFQSRCQGVRRIGCATLSLAYVACGREEGFYEQSLWPWDMAAGILLVEEAGGRATDFRGQPVHLERRQVVASNGLIHTLMLSVLKTSK
ncbi:MAG: inositol monophosphatase [Candidatus Omnitrophica bacterium]|nr:inositol monophosphatase [Candidatus Omnitrophota bacterium]